MRPTRLTSLILLCCALGGRAQLTHPAVASQTVAAQAAFSQTASSQPSPAGIAPGQAGAMKQQTAPLPPTLSPGVERALGIAPLLEQLRQLEQQQSLSGQPAPAQPPDTAVVRLTLRQEVLERVLAASFEVDSVLGRIDTEASYSDEDRYVLQTQAQRQATLLNLVTFAASGALSAAGSAMQLTRGLNHAGTALAAAGGGTALVLSAVQLKAGGGKRAVRSPYNMLAEVLGQTPNAESRYPPLVLAYLNAPRPDSQTSIAEGLTAAWHRLHRIQTGSKGDGAALESLTADRSANGKLSADDLADREAMLHDLRANITLLHADLQGVLITLMLPEAAGLPQPATPPQKPPLPREPAIPPTPPSP